MARKMIVGRPALDRDGVAALTGKAKATVKHWILHRDKSGFPARCNPGAAGKEWYWESEVKSFWQTHQQAKADALTEIDRSGDPDEMITAPQVLRILGYKVTRKLPQALFDNPDDATPLPSGRLRRRWFRKTVWDYAEHRIFDPATGRPAGSSSGPHAPHPYAADPRLQQVITMLEQAEARGEIRGLGIAIARRLGVSEVTASRLLAAARKARQKA